MNTAQVTYDPTEDVLFIETAGARVETRADIDALFEGILADWRASCGDRRRVYGRRRAYDGFIVNLRENDYYAERMEGASVAQFAKTVVRYGGDTLHALRPRRLRGSPSLHTPSEPVRSSRTQALHVVRGLRSGRCRCRGVSVGPSICFRWTQDGPEDVEIVDCH